MTHDIWLITAYNGVGKMSEDFDKSGNDTLADQMRELSNDWWRKVEDQKSLSEENTKMVNDTVETWKKIIKKYAQMGSRSVDFLLITQPHDRVYRTNYQGAGPDITKYERAVIGQIQELGFTVNPIGTIISDKLAPKVDSIHGHRPPRPGQWYVFLGMSDHSAGSKDPAQVARNK